MRHIRAKCGVQTEPSLLESTRVMIVATSVAELRCALPEQALCLVPTMGALHRGHIALIHAARELMAPQGCVAVSIFVNPTQFDRPDDLAAYPRPLDADLAACRAAGVDLVFAPSAAEMYATDHSVMVTENRLSRLLCGASRPGHFAGVCTVVLKLLLLTRAQSAIFGQKDFQQLAIIRRMVRDLNLPTDIISHPTVREVDGLALSSRNARLSTEQRADAPRLHRALLAAAALLPLGERGASPLVHAVRHHIAASPLLTIDYIELVDASTLERVATLRAPGILAVAVFYDSVRLIDHITLQP